MWSAEQMAIPGLFSHWYVEMHVMRECMPFPGILKIQHNFLFYSQIIIISILRYLISIYQGDG